MENLPRVHARSSSGSYLYPLTHSKTHQAGVERPEEVKPLVSSVAAAMQAWLAASGIQEDGFSRRIRKGGHLGEVLAPVAAPGGRAAQGSLIGSSKRTPFAPLALSPGDKGPRRGQAWAATHSHCSTPWVRALQRLPGFLSLRVKWRCSGACPVLGP